MPLGLRMETMVLALVPMVSLALWHLAIMTVRTVVVAGGMSWFVHRSQFAQERRVYRRSYGPGQLGRELRAAVAVVLFDASVLAVVRHAGWIRFVRPTVSSILLTFVVMFVWFEVWFYVMHRLLHTRKLYFLHAQHHVARVTHPMTSLSFSLGERAILLLGAVGFAALASRVMPVTLPGLLGYFLTNYVLNVVGHSNVEFVPPSFVRSRLGSVFITVTFHAMHHARYKGHYGLFTTVLDRLFGTVWEDYPMVHARAVRGEGLTSLGERVAVDTSKQV